MNREAIATTNAPGAVGPYSQAIAAGDEVEIVRPFGGG